MALPTEPDIDAAVPAGSSTATTKRHLLNPLLKAFRTEISLKATIAQLAGYVTTSAFASIPAGNLDAPGGFYGKTKGGTLRDSSGTIQVGINDQTAGSSLYDQNVLVEGATGSFFRVPLYAIGGEMVPVALNSSRSFALTDRWKICTVNSGSAVVATIPANTFPLNTVLQAVRIGAVSLTLAASGVTLNKPSDRALTARAQFSLIGAWQYDTNVWLAWGDLT